MKRKLPHPEQGPFYLLSPTGGTVKVVGPKAHFMALFHVKQFGMRICTQKEWQKAHRKRAKEETL